MNPNTKHHYFLRIYNLEKTNRAATRLRLYQNIQQVAQMTMIQKVIKSDEEWRQQLTPEQYQVARGKGTERAFSGEYCEAHDAGLYACVCCGTELFESTTKFESGTGWPSFTEPIAEDRIRMEKDYGHGMFRIEVLCNVCDAHLGHVFNDGPKPGGMRYCLNSVSLVLKRAENSA